MKSTPEDASACLRFESPALGAATEKIVLIATAAGWYLATPPNLVRLWWFTMRLRHSQQHQKVKSQAMMSDDSFKIQRLRKTAERFWDQCEDIAFATDWNEGRGRLANWVRWRQERLAAGMHDVLNVILISKSVTDEEKARAQEIFDLCWQEIKGYTL